MKALLYLTLFELTFLIAVTVGLWLWVLLVPTVVMRVKRLHVRGALALALPGVVLLTSSAFEERVLRHELAHIKQMRRYSPLGVAALIGWYYGWMFFWHVYRFRRLPSFWSLWERNPLESEANRAMDSDEPLPRLIFWRCGRLGD